MTWQVIPGVSPSKNNNPVLGMGGSTDEDMDVDGANVSSNSSGEI